jgi:hypothetical protein
MLTLQMYEDVRDGKIKPPKWVEDFKVNWPEGKRGEWSVERFTVELDLINLRHMRDGRGCFPGQYTRLHHSKYGVVMSDTTAEAMDHCMAIEKAKGRVLVHGLGLGCFLQSILKKKEVRHVDVVEIDEDIISLISPNFKDDRVIFYHANAFVKKWPTSTKWDVVWHDIWPHICSDNLKEMSKLKRKFGKRCKWQGCWSEMETRHLKEILR